MPSERAQRQIDRLLDEAEKAMAQRDWALLRQHARDALLLDSENADAKDFLLAAERALSAAPEDTPESPTSPEPERTHVASPIPASFANGRYEVKKFLGEGGKKKVYLAHDTLLDRDVAFALIKTEGLDDIGRDRIKREAQAMGRLGAHPYIVSVFDLGEEANGQPYIVTELMKGGDVERLIEKAPEHRPPLERTLTIGIEVCRGLEFAHSHGIVHRDLKPGNVWLTEEGTAKLGDFGLAVALDKTRLTQAGMMVGTVSYMPPEQAMGDEVTPRADLYSLGAMLYEMVTGRPPFLGDESVAIITQHLNSTPIAPTWHNASVPPALEALILRLLEKDPAKRFASAAEVRGSLHQIAQTAKQERAPLPPDATVAVAENPMYRRTFVGREQELRQLQSAYDAATSGQGSLVMVVGEPGIGKTSLCEQLATYAAIRGGMTLVGHCYEEGSLSLPYLPFVEAMRSYVLMREPDELRKDLGSGAGEVARIVSEVRERLAVEPSPSAGDAEEERYRLFQAVTNFLCTASTVQPLVIVLEDLHDADRGTLDLLVHLSRNLSGSRLVVIGTYRDIEVDRAHPLSATLAELRRGARFGRVLLRGLTADEVQRMMSQLSGQEVSWGLAEAVHRQTEGNPLFIQEVLRYLVEEGLIRREDGRWRRVSEETPLEMAIPEGLRDVIGKRLARLSPECNRLLSIAAVIGRDFRLDTLQSVAGVDEDALVAAVEEATRVAVLQEQARVGGIQYRFTHAFFRQTLYEELSAPRRLRFHQQIARILEQQYGTRLEEHAAELAEHFAQSTDAEDLRKAIHYAELAAQRAMSVYAYGESVRHLEQALDVQEVLDPDDNARRCDLLLVLSEALVSAGEPLRVAEVIAPDAVARAVASSDLDAAARASVMALQALDRYGAATMWRTPLYRRWAIEADRYAAAGTPARVWADIALSQTMLLGDRTEYQEIRSRMRGALALARELGDREALFAAGWIVLNRLTAPQDWEERRALAEEASRWPRAGVTAYTLGWFLYFCGMTLEPGDPEQATNVWNEMEELAERTHDARTTLLPLMRDIHQKMMDGDLDEAVSSATILVARGDESGSPVLARQFAATLATPVLLHLGRGEEALAKLPEATRLAGGQELTPNLEAMRALVTAHLGKMADADAMWHRLVPEISTQSALDEEDSFVLPLAIAMSVLEVRLLKQDRTATAYLLDRLGRFGAAGMTYGGASLSRELGAGAGLLGRTEEARRHYQEALTLATRTHNRPEIALVRLGLAEVLLEADDETQRLEGMQHLDFAIAEFRDMKMQPALERALRHKEVLKA
jgi:tetratricopeptide (TPR) repeat protein